MSVAQVNDILLAMYVGYFSRILDIFNKAEVDYNILSIDISYIIDIKMDYIIKGEILCIPFYWYQQVFTSKTMKWNLIR